MPENPPEEVTDLPALPEESKSEVEQIEEKGPAFEAEPQQIADLQTFWAGIAAQTAVSITGPIDAPVNYGEASSFSGSIVFREFPDSGRSFHGEVKRIHGDNPYAPNVALILPISGVMASVAAAVRKYTAQGEKVGNVIRWAESALPIVFATVFAAIKEKSGSLYWTRGSAKENGGKPVPLVTYIYDDRLDRDLGVNLLSSFEGMRAEINKQAEEILTSQFDKPKAVKVTKTKAMQNAALIRKFVLEGIPEDRFKWSNRMIAKLTLADVKALGGDEVVQAIKEISPIDGRYVEGDHDHFWMLYEPDADTVLFENKHLTDRHLLEQVQRIWSLFGHDNPKKVYKAISDKFNVKVEDVKTWFRDLAEKLTPAKKKKVEEILDIPSDKNVKEEDLPPGISKVAYPDTPWAGPTLQQVGGLVGDAQAKWASELAGNLAARFDYISYPKLVGGPSDLRKLATLPLTPTQIERVSKYRALSEQILRRLIKDLYMGVAEEEEGGGIITPSDEEIGMLAEDVLLEAVDATPSSMPDDEFVKELKSRLFAAMKHAQKNPHAVWPSLRTNPEDALHNEHESLDPTTEMVGAGIEKKALQRDDLVQIIPGHPHVHKQFHGQRGKILDATVDLFMCPEHGPEPLVRYVVQLESAPGSDAIVEVTADEVRPVNSTN